jgi:hypothetical protein
MKSVFRRGITPEETLDAIAESAYEEFQLKVPKEKIMITVEKYKKHIAAVKTSIRKEMIAARGKKASKEEIQKRFKQDNSYIFSPGEIFSRDVQGASGYQIRIFSSGKGMGNTPHAWYQTTQLLAHEIGHALQFEFENDVENKNKPCPREYCAWGKYGDSYQALISILDNKEIKKYHLNLGGDYSYQTMLKCVREDIKNAEEKLKNTETAEKKQRIEKIISHLFNLEEAVSEIDILHKEELKEYHAGTEAHKKNYEILKSKAYTAIKEGWAQYFSMVVMQNLVAKEIVKEDRHFLGRIPEETISKTWGKEEYLTDKVNYLIDRYYTYLWWGQKSNDFYGRGFRRFMNLSKEEAKELALNYRYDMLTRINAEEGGGK